MVAELRNSNVDLIECRNLNTKCRVWSSIVLETNWVTSSHQVTTSYHPYIHVDCKTMYFLRIFAVISLKQRDDAALHSFSLSLGPECFI